jgi:hypothetical protein
MPTGVIDLRHLGKPKGKREGVCLQTKSHHLGLASGYFQINNNIAYWGAVYPSAILESLRAKGKGFVYVRLVLTPYSLGALFMLG